MNSAATTISVIRSEQALALALAAPMRWLHPLEYAGWRQIRSPLRRDQWLAGRWWLKRQLLQRWNLDVAPSGVRIVSRDANNLGVAPQAFLDDRPLAIALSLSHSEHFVAVAIGGSAPGRCGIDLVDPQQNGSESLRAWISEEDRRVARAGEHCSLVHAWAAKEAAFKTLVGEPFSPGRIALHFDGRRAAPSNRGANSLAHDYYGAWSYRRGEEHIQGTVELREHTRFVLAVAYRHSPC